MAGTPQFVDISQFQPEPINWPMYKEWAAQWDGISRVAIRSSYSVGYVDQYFAAHRANALSAGIDQIIYYHYAYPEYNSPSSEANSQLTIVGSVRPQDVLRLDFEEGVPQATAEWAYEWLVVQEANYGKLPGIYASDAYIRERLQDSRLARFKLWLANWEFTPDERPPCPPPWTSYEFVQYTDNASIPGIPETVDADIFLGVEPMANTVPTGWSDDGTTLTAPNKVPVRGGFRDHVLASNWDPNNFPLQPEYQANPVEQSNPSLGAGAAQEFRWKRLGWCKSLGIYEGWLGQELVWYQKQYPALQAQVATLQAQITTMQAQITQLESMPVVANFQQIGTIGKQIADDVALIIKLVALQ